MAEQSMTVESAAFEHEGPIPTRYSCDGQDVSPQLAWSGAPENTVTYAILMEDPDAPGRTFVHWVYYDIPADTTELPEAIAGDDRPVPGGTQGSNSFGNVGYGGPCPPGGTHRYFFTVYALDTELGLAPGVSKQDFLDAAAEHVLAQGTLMGTFGR
mgnify:CR=1 FL=1